MSITGLIADDEPLLREHLAAHLARQWPELELVAQARNGREAVELFEQMRPDVVFLDIGMPALDGHETARRIRQEPWGKDMVLVALTGWGQSEDRRRSQEAGFNHHLVKPADPSVVAKLISSLG